MLFRCLSVALISIRFLDADPVIAGYYSPWSSLHFRDVPYGKLTHLYLSFFMPDANGNMPFDSNPNIDSVVARAHAAGVKVLPAMGGINTAGTFSAIAASPAKRANLAHTARRLLETEKFDGLDIDWEFPALPDTANLRLLVTALRDTFNVMGKGKLITLAVNSGHYYGQFYRLERFIDKYDLICTMTYDMAGTWSAKTWHNSPLFSDGNPDNYSVKQAMDYWVGRGVPKSKLLTGTAFYGRTFANATGINQPNKGPGKGEGAITYREIVPLLNSGFYQYRWDSVSQVPWGISSTDEFITFDDPRSVAVKGRWLKAQGYAGTAIWEISGDLRNGTAFALLDSLYLSMHPPTAAGSPGIVGGKKTVPWSSSVRPEWAGGFDAIGRRKASNSGAQRKVSRLEWGSPFKE